MPNRDLSPFKIVLLLIAILVIPAALTLGTVEHPGEFTLTVDNPTPLGYTWSLLMFIFPIIVILTWLHRNPVFKLPQKAFWLTIAVLTPVGFLLDILFGSLFFNFLNSGATLGINLPGYDFTTHHWNLDLPIEEFVFYFTGFMAVLLLYLWCDEYWFSAYNVPDYKNEIKSIKRILSFHQLSLVIGALLIVAAIIYKKFGYHPYQGGFPGYFTFLVFIGIIPGILFFRTVRSFINWRAFSFTFFFITLISLIWEATLGIPYQWWGYNYDQMIGITIGAWFDLPIEAVLVWMAVSFSTVTVFETIKIRLNMSELSLRDALLGFK
jgi:hypothetical protein